MPSKLPRVTVLLQPKSRAIIDRFAEQTGKSKSKVVNEIFEAAVPELEKLSLLMDKVADMDDQRKNIVMEKLSASHDELLSSLEDFSQTDWVEGSAK